MTDDSSPSAHDTDTPPSAGRSLARVGAVLLAVGVVAYLIYSAQARADAGLPPADGEPAAGKVQELLPSSKFRVIRDGAFFNDGGVLRPHEAGDEAKAVLPSSKSLVLEPDPTLLFSSKSGAPVPAPAPAGDANKQDGQK